MIVNTHAHVVAPKVAARMKRPPHAGSSDIERLLERHEAAGVDTIIVSRSSSLEMHLDRVSETQALEDIKESNDWLGDLMQRYPGKIVGTAATIMNGGDAFLREVERAVKEIRLRGVMVAPYRGDDLLDSPRCRPFVDLCAELGIPIYIHPPVETMAADRLAQYRLIESVGRPCETTICLARLITQGLLEQLPTLKVVAAHLGGALAIIIGRIDFGYELREDTDFPEWGPDYLSARPSEYLKRIYVDSVSYFPPALRCAVEVFGADHVMLGTDTPPLPLPIERSIQDVKSLGLGPGDEANILGGNARRIFRF